LIGDSAPANPNEKIYLEVVNANGASARFPTSMEVTLRLPRDAVASRRM